MIPSAPQSLKVIIHSSLLTLACWVSYLLMTNILYPVKFLPEDDKLLGGMWSVVATVYVYQSGQTQTRSLALLRMAATSVSFVLCLAYLLIFPFHAWGMALLIGLGSVVVSLMGQPEAGVTTGITTAVIMVVAGISPHEAWKQPILRLLDTTDGVVVGLLAAGIGRHIVHEDSRDNPRELKCKRGR
jgi:Fusaric acid resistance protein-like